MRFLGISLLTLSVTVLGGLLGGSSVNAQSVYDNAYRTTDELIIRNEISSNHNGEFNATNYYQNWIEGIEETLPDGITSIDYVIHAPLTDIEDMRTSWNNAENWSISTYQWANGFCDKCIILYWSSSNNLQLNWTESNVSVVSPDNTLYQMQISMFGSTIRIEAGSFGATGQISTISSATRPRENYVTFVNDVNYPPDYDGELIRDTVIPSTQSGYIPNWGVRFNGDWEVEWFDQHFFSFDGYPFLCGEEGFAPTIDYSIYEKDDPSNVLDSGVISATGFTTYQFPEIYGEVSEYEITGIYTNCEGYIFENHGTHSIRFNRQGGQQIDNLIQNCLKDEFPFVDYNECIASIEEFINALYFTNVTFGNEWTGTEGCYELAVLHTWLHLEQKDRVLCPQFSSTVRSIVTPFITFFLGMVMVSFLVRRTHNSYESDL